jgi:hypothetical protein
VNIRQSSVIVVVCDNIVVVRKNLKSLRLIVCFITAAAIFQMLSRSVVVFTFSHF